jgi:hypothetical protein
MRLKASTKVGLRYAMTEQLAISLQFSQLVPPEKKATKALAGAAKSVKDFVETFRGSLLSTILNSSKFSFTVFLLPKVANRKELAEPSDLSLD